ncbi:MAG: hypothetical protein VKI83_06535 [Synechococcaceae cyanobacterium]|nr:hypothetical protein [Synechococcaceae cyanobacterium]
MLLLRRLAAAALAATALAAPARACDLHFCQNGTSFSGEELRRRFDRGLPPAYDQAFPEQRWSTVMKLDAHHDQGLVVITLGHSPWLSATQALLPVASFSVIEALPPTQTQWKRWLTDLASRYAQLMLANRSRILNQP